MKTIDEIRSRQTEIRSRLSTIHTESKGDPLSDELRTEWNDLNTEFDTNTAALDESETRSKRIAELAAVPANVEPAIEPTVEAPAVEPEVPGVFHTRSAGAVTGDAIYDLGTIRGNALNPGAMTAEIRDRAMRSVSQEEIPNPDFDEATSKANVERLLKTRDKDGDLSRRILTTGSPLYRSAFLKVLAGEYCSPEEQRALSLTGEKGGFAVPYQLDPTVILTSNGVINPIRQIARVEQITGETWKGITSAGVTAAYSGEAEETEEAPLTFAQPEVSAQRASVLILASFEITQDWAGVSGEVAKVIADSKDVLEAEKFATGTGTKEPFGFLTGATEVVTTATTEVFAPADLYALKGALPPRFRPNGTFVANDAIYDRVRQFDTAGGANLWVQLQDGRPPTLLGKKAVELSTMNAEIKSTKLNMVYGDFSNYLIADRIGMGIEVINHVMNGKKATGQRGFYAFWRNGAKVIAPNAFRVLKGK